jgi:hypothetical protein
MASSGAGKAADATREATAMSVASQEKMFGEMKDILAPFVNAGYGSLDNFLTALPGLTESFDPTMQQLEQTPGYQFALDQGMKGVQNSFASKGLANSGAALKGGAQFAQGLASQTFQQQFQNDLAQKGQQFNMLLSPVQMGANAAAMTGGNAMQLGTNLGNSYQSQGNALSNIYMQDAQQKNGLLGTLLGGVMGFL